MIKNISEWQVETPNGFEDFSGVRVKKSNNFVKIIFSNDAELICTKDHKLFQSLDLNSVVKAIDSLNKTIICKSKTLYVKDIIELDKLDDSYDLLNVGGINGEHRYYVNEDQLLISNCLIIDEINKICLVTCLIAGNTRQDINTINCNNLIYRVNQQPFNYGSTTILYGVHSSEWKWQAA